MRLLAWKVSTRWTQFHISAIGTPLCGTPKPDTVQASIDKPAEIKDWAHVCAKCRTLAIKGATSDDSSDAPVSPAPLTLTERGA